MLSELGAPEQAPEVTAVREQLQSWRFYDHFRTDPDAPARRGHTGTRTPVLGVDGSDPAAARQTIVGSEGHAGLDEATDRAFPGSRLKIVFPGAVPPMTAAPGFSRWPSCNRDCFDPWGADELSDGTLRYLLPIGAMLSPRPPALFVLNGRNRAFTQNCWSRSPVSSTLRHREPRSSWVTHTETLVDHLERVGDPTGAS
jgi:predicted ATPase